MATVDVTKYSGETNGGYIVMFKSNNATHSFANGNNMVTYCYEIINACAGEFTDNCIQELQANSDVEGIYEDGIGGINAASEWAQAIQTNATWGLARLSSKTQLKYTNVTATDFTFYYDPEAGQSSDIYVIDTGVYLNHTDFGGRARWGATFAGKPNVDENGHGTFCAGLAAGATYGVAKKANIIAVKVMNGTGIRGLDYVHQTAQISGRSSVVSFSLTWEALQPLDDAVDKLAHYEIPVVVSAGNNATNASLFSPGRASSAITIAASNILDQQIVASNSGEAIFMFAPGSNIISAYIGNKDATAIHSGTSASAAYVAGIVASFQIHGKMSVNWMKFDLDVASLKGILKDNKASMTPNRLAQNGYALHEEQE
ncbi:hypothetical protein C0995_011607 [Termitomyces sp. Mi166|nr:hypothetical protein C0995_011607 [Termitomyces sp. Mi166\